MPELSKTESDVVKLADELTVLVDAWALANATNRSDAIRRLIELGLRSETKAKRTSQQDAIAIEHRTAQQLET